MKRCKGSVLYRFAIASLLFSLFFSLSAQAKIKMMRITPAKEKVVLNHYRIADVIDERIDQGSIGYLSTGAHNYFLQANFKQPLPDELREFFNESTVQPATAEELVLHVYNYLLYEKSSFKGAEIAHDVHYALFNKAGERLLDYSSTETRNTGMIMAVNAGQLLRESLVDYLHEMDTKIAPILALHKSNDPIKVSYVFVKEPQQKNLLPYNPQHPLNIYHFVAKAPENAAAPSEADCGLMINYQVREMEGGKSEAFIELLPYFDQARSWMKPGQDVRKVLAYEQTYFKISAFITNELVKELKEKTFTFSSLKSDIDALREKYLGRMKELQKQYIQETEYGRNTASMEAWSRKIAFYPAYNPNK